MSFGVVHMDLHRPRTSWERKRRHELASMMMVESSNYSVLSDPPMSSPLHFVTLGMFIIDDFSFSDENGVPTGRKVPPQERPSFLRLYDLRLNPGITLQIGGGTYTAIGARIWSNHSGNRPRWGI